MENKNNKIKLDGKTAQEQAAQFLSLLKDKKLSVEELTQLIPLNADFVKELTNIIEKETDAGKERYASSMEVIKAILSTLKQVCEDGKITSEERKTVIDSMKDIATIMRDIEIHHNDNEHWTKRLIAVLAAIVILPIGIMAAANNN